MANVLIIAPHADDEVLGCGAAIQWHVEKGDTVYVVILSNRVINHHIDEDYIKETKSIAIKVANLLGIKEVFFKDLYDETLGNPLIDVIIAIESAVEKTKPQIAYIPSYKDIHQDHRATFESCKVALRFVDRVLAYEIVNSAIDFSPNVFLNAEKYLDKKLQAIELYGEEIREFPYPRSLKGVKIMGQNRGMKVYRNYVEAFELIKDVIE